MDDEVEAGQAASFFLWFRGREKAAKTAAAAEGVSSVRNHILLFSGS